MNIGFIGVGKISSALVEGFCTSQLKDYGIYLSPRGEANSKRLAQQFEAVRRVESNQQVVDESDFVFLSVLPKDVERVVEELIFKEHQIVINLTPFFVQAELEKAVLPAKHASKAVPLPSVIYHNCPIPVLNPIKEVMDLFSYIGQPLPVDTEQNMHTIWTITGLISPFYDMMGTVSDWAKNLGVEPAIADQYVADMYQSLAYAAQQSKPVDFEGLAKHAATPGGMNEQAGREIRASKSHEAYKDASDNLLARFKSRL